jgi:hypothetical protein
MACESLSAADYRHGLHDGAIEEFSDSHDSIRAAAAIAGAKFLAGRGLRRILIDIAGISWRGQSTLDGAAGRGLELGC